MGYMKDEGCVRGVRRCGVGRRQWGDMRMRTLRTCGTNDLQPVTAHKFPGRARASSSCHPSCCLLLLASSCPDPHLPHPAAHPLHHPAPPAPPPSSLSCCQLLRLPPPPSSVLVSSSSSLPLIVLLLLRLRPGQAQARPGLEGRRLDMPRTPRPAPPRTRRD